MSAKIKNPNLRLKMYERIVKVKILLGRALAKYVSDPKRLKESIRAVLKTFKVAVSHILQSEDLR